VSRFWVGADIGGTFTDVFALDTESGRCLTDKVLTDHKDPTQSVAEGVSRLLGPDGLRAQEIARVLHATTLVTNAVIQRRGAKTALLVTEGFRDAIEIGTEHRFDLFDLSLEKPRPIVPRHRRRPIRERVLADGRVERPLDREQAEGEVRTLLAEGVEAIAVCLHHGFRNPVHEHALRELIARLDPRVHVSLASDVAPEIREYERSSTTAINAYVAPVVGPYLRTLQERLERLGVTGQLLIMQSNGGTATAETSQRYPVRSLESGPAAGAIGAAYIARRQGKGHVLFFDMGGTTAKASIVDDGQPLVARRMEVARVYRFKPGSGLPVQIPAVDMIEIGAGGGSIAHVDRLGLLKVGPDSAESEPGPACYGLGGTQPTVTDADLVLGLIGAENFLGGRMRLDVEAAERALADHVARPLGCSLVEAAWGIHQVVNENMASAARVHLLEHGKNPARYAMVVFGGAGPVHAHGITKALGLGEWIVPWQASVGSAYGLLCAPVTFEVARSRVSLLEEVPWREVDGMLAEMLGECRRLVEWAGVAPGDITESRVAEMRYRGQGHEVAVALDGLGLDGRGGAPDPEAILERFQQEYERLYFRRGPRAAIEVLTWRAIARGPVPTLPTLATASVRSGAITRRGTRRAYFAEAGGYVEAPVVPRTLLGMGEALAGPAMIEQGDSTIVIGPGATARVGEDLLITVTRGGA
jgi:N-methylhydantoinase A